MDALEVETVTFRCKFNARSPQIANATEQIRSHLVGAGGFDELEPFSAIKKDFDAIELRHAKGDIKCVSGCESTVQRPRVLLYRIYIRRRGG